MKLTIDVDASSSINGTSGVLDAIEKIFHMQAKPHMKPERVKPAQVFMATISDRTTLLSLDDMSVEVKYKPVEVVRFELDGSMQLDALQKRFFKSYSCKIVGVE